MTFWAYSAQNLVVVAAFCAGALALGGGAYLAASLRAPLLARVPRLATAAQALSATIDRAGKEGRDPGAAERRRLLAATAAAAFAAATLLAGAKIGALAAAGAPFAIAQTLKARRERYRQAIEEGAADIAIALSDALAGGRSLRGAIGAAAAGLAGRPGRELARVHTELELGARTDDALESMRRRIRGPGIDTIVAAALLQREAGGDLARLLRDCARAADDSTRLARDARAATAQARFTGLIVVLLPLGGAVLAELASPGFIQGLAGSFLTAWLAGLALVLQIVAAIAIRRLARVTA